MWMLELNTLRSWSPRPLVTPIVAIIRAWRRVESKENFKQLYFQFHSQWRIDDDSTTKNGLKSPKTMRAGRKQPLPSFCHSILPFCLPQR